MRRANLNYTIVAAFASSRKFCGARRALRVNLARYVFNADVMHMVTAPVIYSLIIPFALLNVVFTVYQAVCFPVYGIERVKRSDYLIFDRYHLAYPNLLAKLNYCPHANGLLAKRLAKGKLPSYRSA